MDEKAWEKRLIWVLRWVSYLWCLTFSELKKLKECFNALDADGGGSIGLDEL